MELVGNSGCKISLINDEKKIVKKTSSTKAYNNRLLVQMNKQKNVIIGNFRNCPVLDSGYENGLFWFTMDYINGDTLANHIESIELEKIIQYADILAQIRDDFLQRNKEAKAIFEDKIKSIPIRPEQKKRDGIINAMSILTDYSWEMVNRSPCHGDLTMENIIIQNNELYLIDFLDSFYDSWIIDYAKIFQDVDVMWSYRNKKEISSNVVIRLTIIRDLLIDYVLSMKNGEEIVDCIYHMLLLNLLRIYPYAKDINTERFLDEKIVYVNRKIECQVWR